MKGFFGGGQGLWDKIQTDVDQQDLSEGLPSLLPLIGELTSTRKVPKHSAPSSCFLLYGFCRSRPNKADWIELYSRKFVALECICHF